MQCIERPKIELETAEIWHIKDNVQVYYFTVNYFEFNDVRIQIKNWGLTDYYVKFEEQFFLIDKDGRVQNWPPRLFDMMDSQLIAILGDGLI